jgi:hypothetical protein
MIGDKRFPLILLILAAVISLAWPPNARLLAQPNYDQSIPYDPPQASKITIGPANDLGEAAITGVPGAALPLAHVLLVNLNSFHQAHTIAAADGSFSAQLYAPPGSAVMIKHGPDSWRWDALDVGVSEWVNPFPGTIINVPHTHSGDQYHLPFAAAGAIDYFTDDPETTRNYVSSAWAITGTIGPVVIDGLWTRILTGTYAGEATPGLYLGGLNWTHPALADLDHDGDLDLLIGERSGRLTLYRNHGNPASPHWQFETADYAGVATGEWAYPTLADVTNDNALDLFVGAANGTVSIYYNKGTPTAPVWSTSPDVSLPAGNNAAPALADLDGDNDLDLLVGHAGATLYYFRNTGTRTQPAWTLVTSNYASISEPGNDFLQPAFADLDSDADLDLLVGLCGTLVWYRRAGPATNPTWTRVASDPIGYGGGSCATSPGVGNWDGDGDADVLIGEHWGVLRFFRNDGPPAWTEQNYSFPFDLQGESAPTLADWDNDGDLDLLVGQAHGDVYRYTNIGNAASPNWRPDGILLTLPWTNHPHAFPTLGDIDGDNDEDMFIGEGGWQGTGAGGTLHYYRNDGTPSAPNWILVTHNFRGLDVGGWSTPSLVDIDDDNDLDLFIGDEAGTLTFVRNTGTPTTPTRAAPVQPYAGLDLGAYSAPTFLDVDQDGDLDLLAGLENGSLAYVRNTGTVNSPAWEVVTTIHPDIDVGDRSIPTAADVDGNGQADLFIGDIDGGLNLYLYRGPGTPPAPGASYAPGDLFQVKGTLRLHSPAINATTNVGAITVEGWPSLLMLSTETGQPIAAENYFMSSLLTPGGFPIQGVTRSIERLEVHFDVSNLRYLGGHTIAGDLFVNAQLPDDLPPGLYRPLLALDFNGVPTSTTWLAANVVHHTFYPNEAALPPIRVAYPETAASEPRLHWRLLMDDFVQGMRGVAAREDQGSFDVASDIVSQGAPYITPPVDARTGLPIIYRLEPFLPQISFTDRRMPTPPLIPLALPGGQICVVIQKPDGSQRNLGCEAFAQSFHRTKTTRGGEDLNSGTVQLEDVYSLKAASNRFRIKFDQYGHHIIRMTGTVGDLWGNSYSGGGTYDMWIAHPLDIDPGVLPGTPLAVGDAFNPAMQFYPPVPATVMLTVTLYPNSNPAQALTQKLTGKANSFGFFSPSKPPLTLSQPGEYRVDLVASYIDSTGEMYMGAMTWGGVVMTPPGETDLVAHGWRGVDSLTNIPTHWFVSCRDLPIQPGNVSHTLNPYFNGDIVWSRMTDAPGECPAGITSGGDSLIMGASAQDTTGVIEAVIQTRANRMQPGLSPPGDLSQRFSQAELPLFISTQSGRPAQLVPDDVDQMAYSYRSSQRPGVRVREVVAEDGHNGGYWRLNTLYDDQLGVGIEGDLPNDYKFQYVGLVYRDLDTGHREYLGQGSGWVFIPDNDRTGSRVMPPFAGPGNGGWTTEGGPLLVLQGKDIHIFILPTGVHPGAVLQPGDVFRFAGHVMPTLNSQVAVTVTAPSGIQHLGGGQANAIGYFYDPADDFVVNEPGLWLVDVRVWHEGHCSGGATIPPYPSGDVLGSQAGHYWFYVAPVSSPSLDVASPVPGFLSFADEVTPIAITGSIPTGLTGVTVDYTITMPGYIIAHGQVAPSGGVYQFTFDPVALHQDFPNLDLNGRDEWRPGLADTITIGLLLHGQTANGSIVYRANTIILQGEQVFVEHAEAGSFSVYLPFIVKR